MTRRRAMAAGLAALGAALTVSALAHPGKAWLGQRLLSAVWTEGGKPWPWADFEAYARITAPALGVSAIALSSASGEAMAWGPGRVRGSAAPGAAGLTLFAGHRDSHFAFLRDLAPGDRVVVETGDGGRHEYLVSGAMVVDARSWRPRTGGPKRLALSTCWPFGAETPGPLRYVLFADPANRAGAEAEGAGGAGDGNRTRISSLEG